MAISIGTLRATGNVQVAEGNAAMTIDQIAATDGLTQAQQQELQAMVADMTTKLATAPKSAATWQAFIQNVSKFGIEVAAKVITGVVLKQLG